MKKLALFLIIAALLAGCQSLLPPPADPTPSDIDMQTRVAQILTSMPTATSEVTAEPQQPPTEPAATTPPTEEVPIEPAAPTETTPADTATPEPTEPGAVPTVVITPLITAEPTAEPTAAPTQATVEVTPAQPTPTLSATDPRARLGGATWSDNMDNGEAWPRGTDTFTSIEFTGGKMVLTARTDLDGWRLSWPRIEDYYLEATFQPGTCSGSDHYGLIFRLPEPSKADQGYLLGLTCDGRYSLRRWNARIGASGEMVWLIRWTEAEEIKQGANQVNRLGVLALDDRLAVYINGVLVDEVRDSTFTAEGGFGVFIGSDETDNFTIQVDEMSYWEDPQL